MLGLSVKTYLHHNVHPPPPRKNCTSCSSCITGEQRPESGMVSVFEQHRNTNLLPPHLPPPPPPPPIPPPPSPPHLSAICLIELKHGACVWSTAFSSCYGGGGSVENGWETSSVVDFISGFFFLPPKPPPLSVVSSFRTPHTRFFIVSACVNIPQKQMPLIPPAPHYKICPILRGTSGRVEEENGRKAAHSFIPHTCTHARVLSENNNKAFFFFKLIFARRRGIP